MTWLYPLHSKYIPNTFPYPASQGLAHDGAFATKRKFDMHTGVDLYCDPGAEVRACEDGKVVGLMQFTGEAAQSPWWNDTWAVMVEGASGVICYGELMPAGNTQPGATVYAGNMLGLVLQVRKTDRGKPMTMLHLELYKHGTIEPVWWMHNESIPVGLLDPTSFLVEAIDLVGAPFNF